MVWKTTTAEQIAESIFGMAESEKILLVSQFNRKLNNFKNILTTLTIVIKLNKDCNSLRHYLEKHKVFQVKFREFFCG